MSKLAVFVLILIIAPIIGGIFGITHDQFTYTISHEYFTKFKFFQFELMTTGNEAIFPYPRLQVAIIGWKATWWMGIPIGIILGLEGLGHTTAKRMFSITFKALWLNVFIVFLVGLLGLAYGYIVLSKQSLDNFESWDIPDNVTDIRTFISVSAMHNFSYIGGLIGLIVAIIYTTVIRKRDKRNIEMAKRLKDVEI